MLKLEKLSAGQADMMETVRKEWLDLFFSFPTINRTRAKKAIEWLYEFSKLKKPEVIFVNSPLGAQYAVHIRDQVVDQVRDQVLDQVRDQVRGQVRDQVWGQVWDQVRDQVWGQVRDQVWDQVWGQVLDQVRDQVGGQVWDQVWGQVWGQVVGQVRDQVRGQVWGQVLDQVRGQKIIFQSFSSHGNVSDYGWLSFYDFFVRIGIKLKKKEIENMHKLMEISRSGIYDMIQLDGLCVVCSNPEFVKRNALNALHCENGPAIRWADGYAMHALNGVRFQPDMFEKVTGGNMPFEEILAIPDVDQRTQAMKFGSVDKFLEHAKAKTLDTYTKLNLDGEEINYSLHEIPAGDIFRETAYYMKYDCPSTKKVYMQGVEKASTVAEAMAWKISDELTTVTPETWKTMVPLVHES
jgi:hypothetical protein